LAQEGCKQGD